MLENLSALTLARIQFAFTVSFHILFPAFTIGLASWLAVLEWRWLKTGNTVYAEVYRMWVKIFAVTFGMGVVSGWCYPFSSARTGPASRTRRQCPGAAAGLRSAHRFSWRHPFSGDAVRLEPRKPQDAFRLDRHRRCGHDDFRVLDSLGQQLDADPAGISRRRRRPALPDDWLEVIFQPVLPYRFVHMVTAAYLTTAFVVAGIGAFYLRCRLHTTHARVMFGMAMIMAVFVAPCSWCSAICTASTPWNTSPPRWPPWKASGIPAGAPLVLFGWPDQEEETTRFSLEVPKLSSLILTHDLDGEVKGLKEWPKDERPPAAWVFWSFSRHGGRRSDDDRNRCGGVFLFSGSGCSTQAGFNTGAWP